MCVLVFVRFGVGIIFSLCVCGWVGLFWCVCVCVCDGLAATLIYNLS